MAKCDLGYPVCARCKFCDVSTECYYLDHAPPSSVLEPTASQLSAFDQFFEQFEREERERERERERSAQPSTPDEESSTPSNPSGQRNARPSPRGKSANQPQESQRQQQFRRYTFHHMMDNVPQHP